MLFNFLKPETRMELAKFLAKNGVIVCEASYSLAQLSKEITDKKYEILYSGEVEIGEQLLISMAVIWPKVNGIPSDEIVKQAEIFGQDHFDVLKAYEMNKLLSSNETIN